MALIGTVLGSGLTLLAQRLRQPRLHRPKTAAAKESQSNADQQLKALKQACDNNDATAARVALLAWATKVLPGSSNLNQLSLQADPELKQAILALNEQTYGRFSSDWEGKMLWSAVKRI